MKSIRDFDLQDKRVLVRVDFNVPMNGSQITDDSRIKRALPTLEYIRSRGGKLIVCSHLGRPKGQRVDIFSLAPVAGHLADLLDCSVRHAPDCIGDAVVRQTEEMQPGDVLLLENLRFHDGETENDPHFSAQLARMADVYINDAFAVSHRYHASIVGIPQIISEKGAGFLLQKEIDSFHQAMDEPIRPLVALIGGAKVSSKLEALKHMLDRVDRMIIGGAMANTFLKSQGVHMGASLVEDDLLDTAREFVRTADVKGVKLYMPFDFVVADRFDARSVVKNVTFRDIPDSWLALDIGPATTYYFQEALADAKTIVWNGPMGAFEMDPFARGTMAICHTIASSHALSITGGGDSNAAVKKAGEEKNISYMSTGGGAFLHLMEGRELPGVKALT
ncbi:MAG: phosphoglycerate kinase [Desulfobacterales bacterium]|nr:MAG: phosphoglycerate kinase [Desulfobacterales bacterium]